MSTLHHESLLETCLDEAWENFRIHNKLTPKQMEDLYNASEGVADAVHAQAQRLFDDRLI